MPEWVQLRKEDGQIELVGLKPVPFAHLPNLENLFKILSLCEANKGDPHGDGIKQDIAQKIINLHPREDIPGISGFDISRLVESEFKRLFSDKVLQTHNQYKQPEDLDVDPADADYVPPWSSGSIFDDWLADLAHAFQSYTEAAKMSSELSFQSISNIRHRLADHQRGPEEREKRANRKWFYEQERQTGLMAQTMMDALENG